MAVTKKQYSFSPAAPKKAANVTVNAELLAAAKALNINLSQTLEQGLTRLVRERAAQAWHEENRQAINDYNRRVEKDGVFSKGVRRF